MIWMVACCNWLLAAFPSPLSQLNVQQPRGSGLKPNNDASPDAF